eukprot:CAMPEP_0179851036 /NCGR_PEP_ID=MMETSP0982-20121206/8034_1 /TAXON_ID=483367 /ORGANISM="non described non described, Strain CCMP 2436" /LENGTH=232 /DNA_ID=CAMNT_0021736525 /DNA_START=274 /DNA_END=973 /DNA_ORIENTATION=+
MSRRGVAEVRCRYASERLAPAARSPRQESGSSCADAARKPGLQHAEAAVLGGFGGARVPEVAFAAAGAASAAMASPPPGLRRVGLAGRCGASPCRRLIRVRDQFEELEQAHLLERVVEAVARLGGVRARVVVVPARRARAHTDGDAPRAEAIWPPQRGPARERGGGGKCVRVEGWRRLVLVVVVGAVVCAAQDIEHVADQLREQRVVEVHREMLCVPPAGCGYFGAKDRRKS